MNDTPETDAVLNQFEHLLPNQFEHLLPNWIASEMAAVARKLERERDEAVNIWQMGHSKLVADRDDWKRIAVEQEKEIEEWKAEVERWRSLAQGWRKEAVDAIKDTRE